MTGGSAAELVLGLGLGLGLSAACGFRVFVPLLVESLAARTGYLALAPGFDWIGSPVALAAFAAATLLEVLAYYLPWLDNLLDAIATPAAVIAGILLSASVLVELPPLWRWGLAIIGGGAAAGATQAASVFLRLASSGATGGMGNVLLATGELLAATGLALAAVFLPVLALLLVAIFVAICLRGVVRLFRTVH
jgi:hypothetical protein